jgi:hypothetical protein
MHPMPDTEPSRSTMSWLGGLARLGWVAAIAYVSWRGWPHIPLDLSPSDAATRSAHAAAVNRHMMVSTAVALLPPLGVLMLVKLLGRSRRR